VNRIVKGFRPNFQYASFGRRVRCWILDRMPAPYDFPNIFKVSKFIGRHTGESCDLFSGPTIKSLSVYKLLISLTGFCKASTNRMYGSKHVSKPAFIVAGRSQHVSDSAWHHKAVIGLQGYATSVSKASCSGNQNRYWLNYLFAFILNQRPKAIDYLVQLSQPLIFGHAVLKDRTTLRNSGVIRFLVGIRHFERSISPTESVCQAL